MGCKHACNAYYEAGAKVVFRFYGDIYPAKYQRKIQKYKHSSANKAQSLNYSGKNKVRMPLRHKAKLRQRAFVKISLTPEFAGAYGYFTLGHVITCALKIQLRIQKYLNSVLLIFVHYKEICNGQASGNNASRRHNVSPCHSAYEVYEYHYAYIYKSSAKVRLHHYQNHWNKAKHGGFYDIHKSPKAAFFIHAG